MSNTGMKPETTGEVYSAEELQRTQNDGSVQPDTQTSRLLATIAALQADNAALRKAVDGFAEEHRVVHQTTAERDALQAELTALRGRVVEQCRPVNRNAIGARCACCFMIGMNGEEIPHAADCVWYDCASHRDGANGEGEPT
jgi:hypothetical protein